MRLTEGFLLGGRVRHDQQQTGHRTGIEPVLLAAACPARPGERVLEFGLGSGAALLCLANRVPGVSGVGIERDPLQVAVARHNIAANALPIEVVEGDIADIAPDGRFDHAIANPPWHDPDATASPDAAQDGARRARPGLFALWVARLAAPLRHRGTIHLITATGTTSECLAAFTASGCGSHVIVPLWPRAGRDPKLVLLGAAKDGRAPTRILPGLVLHGEQGYTPQAAAILSNGGALEY
jgi:tRNA1(Val) A37 N6-methylase TrmN6